MALLRSCFLCGLFLLVDCNRRKDAARPVPVRIMVGRSTSFLPVFLGQELGLYRNRGLAVTLDDVSGTTKSTQALLGGSVDVAGGMFEQTIIAASQGRSIISFVALMSGDFRALLVAPAKTDTIRTIEDLRGRTIGVSSVGSPNEFFAASVARRHGLSQKDVSMVAVGTLTNAVAALEHNRIDTAVLGGSGINLFRNIIRMPGFLRMCARQRGSGRRSELNNSRVPFYTQRQAG
jgi:ABC-type nitrate/sulfonate/bicarbonate transport system substrate-binding protein